MDNKKIKVLTIVGVLILLVTVVGLTYAFFQAQSDDAVVRDVSVITHTVDTLTFSVDENIEIEATQQNFGNGGDSQDGEATATAILTPNSKTGAATKNYYLVLYLSSNNTVYSTANTNELPELLLQVFNSSDQLVTLTGLGSQVTVGSLTGYDITGVEGILPLLENHQISASNNTTTTEEWRVVVTLINHNFNQNDNTGKSIVGNLIISEESPVSYVYWNDNFSGTDYTSTQVPTGTGLNGTYATRELLATAYTDWEDAPVYINTTKVNGTITGHTACLWYNNREFCIAPNYWTGTIGVTNATEGVNTKAKLKTDMENALGITIADSSCDSTADRASCGAGVFVCRADSDGRVNCFSDVTDEGCFVYGSGDAKCS